MPPPDSEPVVQATADQGQLDFLAAMKSQLHNSNTSDFKVVCGNTTHNVHRFVIGLHSPYFKRVCEGGFAESEEGSVTLRDDPPFAVELMVKYFYTFEYDFDLEQAWKLASAVEDGTSSPLEVHCWMATLADKYDVSDLKAKALEGANKWLGGFCSFPGFAGLRDPQLLSLTPRAMSLVLRAMGTATEYVFSNTPPNDRSLKDGVVKTWIANDNALIKHAPRESFDKLLADVPEFAAELVAVMSGRRAESGGNCAAAEEGG